MKTLTDILKTALIFCFLLGANGILAQTVITIDNNSGSTTTYTTIQAALDAAANDIIYVQPSPTSYGSATITKPITIVGRSHSETGKVSQLTSVSLRSSNVTIKGINFSSLSYNSSGGTAPPPYVGFRLYECKFSSLILSTGAANNADDIEIRGCLITSRVTVNTGASNVLVANNIFSSPSPIITNLTSSLIVTNNIFRGTSSITIANNDAANNTFILANNIFVLNRAPDAAINLNSGPFNLSNNLIHNYGTGNFSFASNSTGSFLESNTLNTAPLFTDVDPTVTASFAGTSSYNPLARLDDDLTLQAGSPALTAGVGNSELGIFSNGFNYKYLGNPRGIPTFNIVTSDGTVPANGNINVTVTARAH
jgi:hypothetical protein